MTTINDAAVAAAAALYDEERNESMGFDEWPDFESADNAGRELFTGHARAAITAALPHLRQDWEAPLRELAEKWLQLGTGTATRTMEDTEDACAIQLLALLLIEPTA